MIQSLKNLFTKRSNIMGRKKLANSTKFLNALLRGETITWAQARTTYNLQRPRAVVEKLREDGHCVYINKTTTGTLFNLGNKPWCKTSSSIAFTVFPMFLPIFARYDLALSSK